MPYCTRSDLIDRFGKEDLQQLTDREDRGIIDNRVLDKAIADADAEINAKLKARYTLPLSPVPPILNLKACYIALYYLHGDSATDQVIKFNNDAMAYLKDVRDGKESLDVDDPAPETSSFRTSVQSKSSSYDWGQY